MKSRFLKSSIGRYWLAFLITAGILVFKQCAGPAFKESLTLMTYPAMLLSAWYAGFGPGVFSTVLCILFTQYYQLKPVHSLEVADLNDTLRLVVFFLLGTAFSYLIERERRYSQKLKAKEEQLRTAFKTRDTFISLASQELKNPITSLAIQVQLISRSVKSQPEAISKDTLLSAFAQLQNQINRLSGLADTLLDTTQLDQGGLELQLSPVDLSELVHEICERYGKLFENSECLLQISAATPVIAECDRYRMEQVVTNLLTNAVKYAPGLPIEVKVEKTQEGARISVRDHGPGIPREDRERIFQRFERATAPGAPSGLGIGLFLSKRIAQVHHGDVKLTIPEGRGSLFSVQIPLSQQRFAEAAKRESQSSLPLKEASQIV